MMIAMIFSDAVFIPDENGELTQIAAPPQFDQTALPATDVGMALFKMLLTLFLLAALIYASYWFLKRLIRNRLEKGVGKRTIEILEKRMVSPKTTLYLVQVEEKKVLFAESHLEVKALETFQALSETPQEASPQEP